MPWFRRTAARAIVTSRASACRSVNLWVELTEKCQLKCRYCYNPWRFKPAAVHGDVDYSVDKLLKFVRGLSSFCEPSLTLAGGDPTAFSGLEPLIRQLTNEFGVTIVTHGCNINEHLLDALAASRNVSAQISIPSLDGPEFAFLTGGAELRNALEGVVAVRRAGIKLGISCVATRVNARRIPEFADFSRRVGARYLLINRFLPSGRGALYCDRFSLSLNEFNEVVNATRRAAAPSGPRVIKSGALPGVRARKADDFQISIGIDGSLSACNMTQILLGSLKDDPAIVLSKLERFWLSDEQVPGCHCSQVID